MNFGFSEEQDLLRSEVRKFLDGQCPLDEVRRIAASTEGFSRPLWKQIAELGWTGIGIPERYGGSGLGWEERVVVLEETGRGLFPSALLNTTVAAALILDEGDETQRKRWLPAIAGGSCIATVAVAEANDHLAPEAIGLRAEPDGDSWTLHGEKPWVGDAPDADLFLVAARTGDAPEQLTLFALEANTEGVSVEPAETLDATKRAGTLRLAGARATADHVLGPVGEAWPAIERHLDRGAIALSAEIIGASEGAHAITVQFAKDRIQFGSPIGRYQGVKHVLADRYVDIESLKSLVYFAAWALDKSPAEVPLAASKAKAHAAESFLRMGVDGIQLHGAVGYTEEYDIQLYLKRSKWARPVFGDEVHHQDRIATLGGL